MLSCLSAFSPVSDSGGYSFSLPHAASRRCGDHSVAKHTPDCEMAWFYHQAVGFDAGGCFNQNILKLILTSRSFDGAVRSIPTILSNLSTPGCHSFLKKKTTNVKTFQFITLSIQIKILSTVVSVIFIQGQALFLYLDIFTALI